MIQRRRSGLEPRSGWFQASRRMPPPLKLVTVDHGAPERQRLLLFPERDPFFRNFAVLGRGAPVVFSIAKSEIVLERHFRARRS